MGVLVEIPVEPWFYPFVISTAPPSLAPRQTLPAVPAVPALSNVATEAPVAMAYINLGVSENSVPLNPMVNDI